MIPVSSASSPVDTAGSIATSDPHQIGQVAVPRPARLLDAGAAPQGTGDVVKDLGIEFLAAEPRTFVFADDLGEKPGRQIGAIFIGRAPRYRNIMAFAGEQFADQLGRPRRRRNQAARVASQSQ